ncbi:hypothetical protein LLG95_13330 [bacterium]|nr:hypothetical protein [bacterium]
MSKKKDQESEESFEQIDIGDQVKHVKWGVGTVLFRSGSGDNAKAIVVFPEEGQKKLMLKYAKLKKVGTTSLKSVERLKHETPEPRVKPEKVTREPEEGEEIELEVGSLEIEPLEDEEEVVGFDEDEEEEEISGSEDEREE